MTKLINSLFGIGHLRPAPGTWGSLAALPLAAGLHGLGGFGALFLATLVVAGVGIWTIGAELGPDTHDDPSHIVIDEVAGQWVALWPVSLGAVMAGVGFLDLWPGIVTAFLAFRLFDIWKPAPVAWADRQAGAVFVMLDDVIAGWLAALVVAVLAAVAHLWLI